jgi:hypothetical protein
MRGMWSIGRRRPGGGRRGQWGSWIVAAGAMLAAGLASGDLLAQAPRGGSRAAPPSIEEKTTGMKRIEGFIPLYWDEASGQLWMEIARWNTELLHANGFGSGLGSNDIGLDRGQFAGSRIVFFERVGPKVLLVQPNYRFRALSSNPAEVRGVRDAFARSVLWGFTVAAQSGDRVLVDATEWLLRDGLPLAPRLRPGTYRFEPSRSAVYMAGTAGFPRNTEIEVELTFALQQAAGPPQGGPRPGPQASFGGGGFFEGVSDVAAAGEAASLRIHHSLVELPDAHYTPRAYDPRSGYGSIEFANFAAALGEPRDIQFVRRHRLAKKDPSAKVSEAVAPIVYYVDPGAPEQIRNALLEGARWWNQAFEAAGYRDAFRVELLPEGASPLDIRYNVINWVHRSTRGWSTGASVIDPRTGEIIKGIVTLGSLRAEQDYLIAEGLLSPYQTGTETPPELTAWALARIRQLSAHEVGHTLGLGHNYYDSTAGRISVMDYPHPLVTLKADGALDYSSVYASGMGDWDKVAITWGYQDFPKGTRELPALAAILDEAWARDIRYLTNQDTDANPRADQWSNGTDPAAELTRMMGVRRAALARFGEQAIKRGTPMALMEEALVPLYLHHRYQVEAAASALGGQHYIYALRGDGRQPTRWAPAAEQKAALDALVATLQPSELRVPDAVLKTLPPRPSGYGPHRELFPRYTGPTFDAISPAVVAADLTIGFILDAERAARLVQQHALDPALPGLREVLLALRDGVRRANGDSAYDEQIRWAVQRVLVDRLMALVAGASMPQVRAVAAGLLADLPGSLVAPSTGFAIDRAGAVAVARALERDIKAFLERPMTPTGLTAAPAPPPGAPIGEPAMDWLRRPECDGR